MLRFLYLILFALTIFPAASTDLITLSGTITDAATHETLPFATISVSNDNSKSAMMNMHSDANGRWSMRVMPGKMTLTVSYIGYKTYHGTINATTDRRTSISLQPSEHSLAEVVITAKESGGMTSASRIDRDAMEHIQPTSFTDLLELLPGNISQTPDMGSTNSITLRETGNIGASGTYHRSAPHF